MKAKTKNQKPTYQMQKVTSSTYQLLDQGLSGSYFVKFPDGNETRWIPDLCAELNRIYNQLKIEEAENEDWCNTVREAYAARDTALREMQKLTAENSRLESLDAARVVEVDAVQAKLIEVQKERDEARSQQNADERICAQRDEFRIQRDAAIEERDEARYQRDSYRKKVDCLEIQISEFEKALREQNSEELICAKLNVDEMRKQRDEARALLGEASRQRDGWRDEANRLKNKVELIRSNTRPEPSRLELAAMMMAANLSRESDAWDAEEEALWSLEQADALLAAANEQEQND